jgi:hypothetical protein
MHNISLRGTNEKMTCNDWPLDVLDTEGDG